jgi:hypothetical protein
MPHWLARYRYALILTFVIALLREMLGALT